MRRPIGVFDSGIGGLTVVDEIMRAMPNDSVIYFGDTARVPYGTKSAQTVTRFAIENMHFLLRHDVKLVVVACNSASSVALEEISRRCPLPVLGVINPGAVAAAAVTAGKVGVVGTNATVESGAYQRELKSLRNDVEVMAVPCPLFVPLVEEGWIDRPAAKLIAEEYLAPLRDFGADVVVLGCTHYPLLRAVIQDVMGPGVDLVDSAGETARLVKAVLESEEEEAGGGGGRPTLTVYLSDVPRKFESIGRRFLGRPIDMVQRVDQTDLPWYER